LRPYFPAFVSYNRFVELQKETVFYLFLFLQRMPKQQTGIYYVDATKLPVCHIKRTKSNKTFKDIAQLGKTTTGWFFGFVKSYQLMVWIILKQTWLIFVRK
jgi:Transposase DDE domain